MTRILGLSGSLRRNSFNTGLLRAATEGAPDGVEIDARTIRGVPLYDADLEAEGTPQPVLDLRAALDRADGLLMVTPEYNNSVPGVFKNAIDWMSSGDGAALFRDKPVALIGASPGGFGTILSQNAWLPVLRTLGTRPWFDGRMMVSKASGLFDDEGRLTDDRTAERLAAFVGGFAAWISAGH
ncbi:NAD(P)H-dependent oxidoreductase [Salipiger bermudensis]|uniref:NADPH-dependent FMN reductase n=1 Tax=Salipiger bermudensis TaxID=344736 RepID=UPI001C99F3A8|nr:NADPH-dependent FMN reductase [Salipiger bermudensis]MBY6006242.1 NAD(P)H-dependent oxidoreductase [Salipiger bermudensis]